MNWLRLPKAKRLDALLKRRYAQPGKNELDRKRIFILPTKFGIGFSVTLFVMLMGSLNYNNSLGFILTFLLGGVLLVTIFHTYRNLRHLKIQFLRAQPCFAGQVQQFDVQVENPEALAKTAIVLCAPAQDPVFADVGGEGVAGMTISLPALKRGPLPLGILTIETRFPLGLYRAWSYINLDVMGVVYPKPVTSGRCQLPTHSGDGEHDSARHGSEDFAGFRAYQAGDSARRIHWKGVARGGPVSTKQFSQPETDEIWFDWAEVPSADSEEKLSILCRWILDAQAAGRNYGLSLPGRLIEPANGDEHQRLCLQTLALFSPP